MEKITGIIFLLLIEINLPTSIIKVYLSINQGRSQSLNEIQPVGSLNTTPVNRKLAAS